MPISTIYSALKDLLSLLSSARNKRVSKEETDFLLETLRNNNQVFKLTSDQTGDFLRIGTNNYHADEMRRIKYLEMLTRLIELGYITHESGIIYRLTSTGIKAATDSAH